MLYWARRIDSLVRDGCISRIDRRSIAGPMALRRLELYVEVPRRDVAIQPDVYLKRLCCLH